MVCGVGQNLVADLVPGQANGAIGACSHGHRCGASAPLRDGNAHGGEPRHATGTFLPQISQAQISPIVKQSQ